MNYLTYLPVFDKLTKSQQDTLKYFVREGFISLSRGTIEIIDKDGLEKIIV